jgi:N-sulfoglucosamine sulfohydrolase
MFRRQFVSALSSPLAVPLIAAPRPRPNILFITSDDLGLELGCYGEKLIETPHLDRLASTGVRFQTAYVVQASCSPSRSGMFTGLYPHANGQYGLVNSGHKLHDHLHQATIPAVLKKAGYRTGIIGKLHVAPEETFPFDTRYTNSADTRKVRDVTARATEFLNARTEGPFFLMLNYSDPHAFRKPDNPNDWYFPPQVDGLPARPIQPGPQTLFQFQQIDTAGQRERTANYYNAIKRLDDGIGMLMTALEKSGRVDDTVVIFCGDHGPPFARGKTTCYEAGLRVPFVVRWPGVSQSAVSPAMVSTVDIAPTIYDAAGVKAPVDVHGRSLRPVLRSPRANWRRYLAAEFHMHGAKPVYPRRAIRDDRFKLIHNLLAGTGKPSPVIDGDRAYSWSQEDRYKGTPIRRAFDTFADPPEFELYDLQADPIEFNNLADKPEHRGARDRLVKVLHKWRVDTNDPCLDPAFVTRLVG